MSCDFLFNDFNNGYPQIIIGTGPAESFQLHGLGPGYGGNAGRVTFYMYTTLGFGPYGRGIINGNGDGTLLSPYTMSLNVWHTVTVQKFARSITLTVDGFSTSGSVATNAPEFRMPDPGTIRSASDPVWRATAPASQLMHGEVRNMVITYAYA